MSAPVHQTSVTEWAPAWGLADPEQIWRGIAGSALPPPPEGGNSP